MKLKGFIFDMDGVLTETSDMHFMAWQSMAKSIGITIDEAFNEGLKGISRRASMDKILALTDVKYSEEKILKMMDEKNQTYVKMINDFTGENLNPGILDLLKAIRSKKLKIAVASASKSAGLLVELLGIGQFVDYIVDPSTVKGKPNPEIFLKASQSLGLSPDQCIGVEDAQAGIEAILSAGMFAVGVGDEKALTKSNFFLRTTDKLIFEDIVDAFEKAKA